MSKTIPAPDEIRPVREAIAAAVIALHLESSTTVDFESLDVADRVEKFFRDGGWNASTVQTNIEPKKERRYRVTIKDPK